MAISLSLAVNRWYYINLPDESFRQVGSTRDAGESGGLAHAVEQRVQLVAKAAAFQRPFAVRLVGEQTGGNVDGLGALGLEYLGQIFHIVFLAAAGEDAGELGLIVGRKSLGLPFQAGDAAGERTFLFVFLATNDADFCHDISLENGCFRLFPVLCMVERNTSGQGLPESSRKALPEISPVGRLREDIRPFPFTTNTPAEMPDVVRCWAYERLPWVMEQARSDHFGRFQGCQGSGADGYGGLGIFSSEFCFVVGE